MVSITIEPIKGVAHDAGGVRVIIKPVARLELLLISPATLTPPVIVELDLDEAEQIRNALLHAIGTVKDDLSARTTKGLGAS